MSTQSPPVSAFTLDYSGRVNQLQLLIDLSEAYDPRSGLPAAQQSSIHVHMGYGCLILCNQ